MIKEVKEKYLPIGTVVKLIGGDVALMITGFCIKPQGKIKGIKGEIENTEDKYFDYSACPYPTGIMNTEINVVFNHENIEGIVYMGLESKLHDEYNKFLKEEMKKMDKKEENK